MKNPIINVFCFAVIAAAFVAGALLDSPSDLDTMRNTAAAVIDAGRDSAANEQREALLKRSQAERELALGKAR